MTQAKLGQHFLINKNVCEKIIKHFLPAEGSLLEIGPGKGILTERLLANRQNNKLIAVELDNTLFYRLKNKFSFQPDFEVLNRDILKIDLNRLLTDNQTINLVGNVPYYISRDLIDWVFQYHTRIKKGILMMQKEFVDKLTKTTDPGLVNPQAILFNMLFTPARVMDVQPGSFSPQPRVKSTVFLFSPVLQPAMAPGDVKNFYLFLQRCFKNRRKTLFNNLAVSSHTEELWEVFETHHINPKIRAEQLPLPVFLQIYLTLDKHKTG